MARCGYTEGMKTAVSIPDDLYAEAEQMARRLKRSRSGLYADAVREYLTRHDDDAITGALNQVCAEIDGEIGPDGRDGGDVIEAGRRVLERVEW